ncbi:MAG: FtsX-like permease family protein [Candidatus Contubernalis sp.]|nr:FtsX-like permease family protein [Candidatus Contubernalis sp.]
MRQLWGNTIFIDNTSFQVIGLLTSRGAIGGGRDADEIVLIPVSTFSGLFENARVNNLTVWVEIPDEIETVALASQSFFNSLYPDNLVMVRVPSLTTGTRQETSANLSFYLKIIAVAALLVGGVMIMNIMFLSVSERTWEIGLRKALGAKKSDIIKQVLLEVLLVSLAGGVLGIVGGVLAVNYITSQEIVRASLSWDAPVLALVFPLLIGLIFGLRPALRAASLDPVEALRSVE